ncbi:MAG: MerR family transcriptional regulator, partial [Acidobacteriota bacterium]
MIGESPQPAYSVRELSRLTGFSSDRIRAWELRYGLLKPRRQPSGYRTYVGEDLRLLLSVRRRLEAGEKIGKVAARGREALLAGEAKAGPVPEDPVAAALRASILSLRRGDMRRTCHAMDEASRLVDADEFYRSFALPLLVEVGDLWAVEALPIWMEHFVTRHVRRRLEALWAAEEERRGPVAILFCPEGELHEISL